MDAQNAVESATTGQATSPSRRAENPADSKAASHAAAAINNASTLVNGRISPEPKATTTSNGASPPADVDSWHDQNSDAETIVLAGKDGISPSKPRQGKFIKHEDKSDGEVADVQAAPRKPLKSGPDAARNGTTRGEEEERRRTALTAGKKRPQDREKQQRNKDISSGLSSVPASPPPHRRRRSGDARSESGSEGPPRARALSSGLNRERVRNGDKNFPTKRKSAKVESDDEEPKKIRRPRVSDAHPDSVTPKDRDQRSVSAKYHQGDKTANATRDRSSSPHGRPHRRSLSTQLPSQSSNGLVSKKRRLPAPLQATEYHSDDSSASASSHPRNSKVRRLATPLTADSTMSPATRTGHKRHVDNHGQTQFAKACAKGEYEVAKRRLGERPEDLDFADYAGNTPLQVAALNGHEDIVKLLIEAGCNIDCRNSDKETPLLDAVENGHLEVVKLLLDAGVNPRKADAEGHEPLEKVPDDLDNAEEIRAVLREAKEKSADLRPSEDRQPQDLDTVSSQGPDSPRRSPQASAAAQRRGGTMRSTKTSNHLLYMNLDEKTLRHAAARGDEETVTRVLQVREGCDDPEALVGAARGGHNVVMELLLALGGANPDPAPVKGLPPQYSTPMLAAIGQENAKVIKLLLNQSGFDPTRRFKGECYHEIARRREGPLWKEEEHMLKNAYDEYRKAKGLGKKASSSNRREREAEGEPKRMTRKESSPETSRPPKRRPSSVSREGEPKKKVQSAKLVGSPKEKRRADISGHQEEPSSPKRASARPKKDEVIVNTNSDRESTPGGSKIPAPKPKRAESDLAAGSSDGEAFKPRRKLISGRDLKGQRDRQRRSSMASTASNDRGDVKADDAHEKPRAERPSEKYHDRTKALKRDDSRDRHSGGEGNGKRHRASVTPPRHGTSEKDDGEAPSKRRRLDADNREPRHVAGASPDGRKKKRETSPENHKRPRIEEPERKDKVQKVNRERALSVKSTTSERGSITVASDVPEIEMRDAHMSEGEITDDLQAKETAKKETMKKRQAEIAEQEKRDEERKRREEQEEARRREELEKERAAEEKRQQDEAAKKQAEEEERKRAAAAAEEERRRQKEQEAAEKKRLEEEEKARVEKERLQREERERQEKEEAERKRKEEQRKQEEEAKKLREAAEEEKRREEEARIRREREAAEEARKLREEEERKERERKRAAREAEREAELQRIRQEQERARLSKLPPVLRWLDTCPDPKQRQYAELFAMAQGVRYDTINPEATGTAAGREQWLLNTQVALLLGDKDLSLSRYTAWEKVKASNIAKKVIWRLENERYALTQGKLYGLGMQLPDYFEGNPLQMGYKQLEKLRGDAAKLFFDMDLWFVKASDFLFMVPNFPHLQDVKISIDYRELPETESALNTWGATPAKWKQDPDASSRGYFAPRWKYYVNGQFAGEDRPKSYKLSHDPPPERRVPRRGGLIAVTPEEPDYARLCLEQGLGHLLTEEQRQAALAGAHLTPQSMVSNEAVEESQQMSPSERSSTKPVAGSANEPTSPLAQ
ncbi:uncharacterized protein B0I36DRAFT_260682 [Microdochium trichocladiopsis]|uniref:Ankyrin repeat-containing domain protein n=1 Tax=Microdochium trichocladiopsis TaxID=1682393 RepID=A0A9P8YLB8_9PEZI|nr:uncharacterized protein B0I36DRAFT_260682 [Microdochium trichocladiopsis]KAH7041109.1 hypothetical protein B0I36DRAFT_260682 [Microdochium trichocladiopsis]